MIKNYQKKYIDIKNRYKLLSSQYAGDITSDAILSKILSIGFEFETYSILPLIRIENNLRALNSVTKINVKKNDDVFVDITSDMILVDNNKYCPKIKKIMDGSNDDFIIEINDIKYILGKSIRNLEVHVTYLQINNVTNNLIIDYFNKACNEIKEILYPNNIEGKINQINKIKYNNIDLDEKTYIINNNYSNNDIIMLLNEEVDWVPQTTIGIKYSDYFEITKYLLSNSWGWRLRFFEKCVEYGYVLCNEFFKKYNFTFNNDDKKNNNVILLNIYISYLLYVSITSAFFLIKKKSNDEKNDYLKAHLSIGLRYDHNHINKILYSKNIKKYMVDNYLSDNEVITNIHNFIKINELKKYSNIVVDESLMIDGTISFKDFKDQIISFINSFSSLSIKTIDPPNYDIILFEFRFFRKFINKYIPNNIKKINTVANFIPPNNHNFFINNAQIILKHIYQYMPQYNTYDNLTTKEKNQGEKYLYYDIKNYVKDDILYYKDKTIDYLEKLNNDLNNVIILDKYINIILHRAMRYAIIEKKLHLLNLDNDIKELKKFDKEINKKIAKNKRDFKQIKIIDKKYKLLYNNESDSDDDDIKNNDIEIKPYDIQKINNYIKYIKIEIKNNDKKLTQISIDLSITEDIKKKINISKNYGLQFGQNDSEDFVSFLFKIDGIIDKYFNILESLNIALNKYNDLMHKILHSGIGSF